MCDEKDAYEFAEGAVQTKKKTKGCGFCGELGHKATKDGKPHCPKYIEHLRGGGKPLGRMSKVSKEKAATVPGASTSRGEDQGSPVAGKKRSRSKGKKSPTKSKQKESPASGKGRGRGSKSSRRSRGKGREGGVEKM